MSRPTQQIIESLRDWAEAESELFHAADLMREAADEIERLYDLMAWYQTVEIIREMERERRANKRAAHQSTGDT